MALQSLAFDHYDKSLKDGEPTAAKIAAGLMNLPELDQKTAAARRSEWSRSRCVEYLRSEIFRSNKELVSIAKETKSDAIHVAIIDAIYNAIATAYPHIKAEAADMAVRKKLELARNGRKTSAAVMSQAAESELPSATPEAPKATLAGVADEDLVRTPRLTHGANREHPTRRAFGLYTITSFRKRQSQGITLDAQAQAAAWTMSILIQSSHAGPAKHTGRCRLKVEPLSNGKLY